MKLHSQDLAPWGSWGVFNVTALAQCLDYVVPMAYCSPASSTVAGPTDPFDNAQRQLAHDWQGVPPEKIIVGLPLFGYNFKCTNPKPLGSTTTNKNSTCLIVQPPQYPTISTAQAWKLFASENVTSGAEIQYDKEKASAWFEYTNRSSGDRHQVWFEDHRSVAAKAAWITAAGYSGLSFWTLDSLYTGAGGEDSAAARAVWHELELGLAGGDPSDDITVIHEKIGK